VLEYPPVSGMDVFAFFLMFAATPGRVFLFNDGWKA